jgi:hypothetical protein
MAIKIENIDVKLCVTDGECFVFDFTGMQHDVIIINKIMPNGFIIQSRTYYPLYAERLNSTRFKIYVGVFTESIELTNSVNSNGIYFKTKVVKRNLPVFEFNIL